MGIEELAAAVAEELAAEASGFFAADGAKATEEMAAAILNALAADLTASRTSALRACLSRIVPQKVTAGMTFHDLRRLCATTRRRVLDAPSAQAASAPASPRAVEDWLQELALSSAQYYAAQREITIANQAAQLEIQLLELRDQKDAQQRTMEQLRQSWVPIAPIHEGILAVPLVGALDAERAAELTTRLLNEVTKSSARFVLLDISGVPMVDTATAERLIGMARTVKLLGAEMLLVGVSPEIARTIVALGVDLSQLNTKGSLRDGLRVALARLGLHVTTRA